MRIIAKIAILCKPNRIIDKIYTIYQRLLHMQHVMNNYMLMMQYNALWHVLKEIVECY